MKILLLYIHLFIRIQYMVGCKQVFCLSGKINCVLNDTEFNMSISATFTTSYHKHYCFLILRNIQWFQWCIITWCITFPFDNFIFLNSPSFESHQSKVILLGNHLLRFKLVWYARYKYLLLFSAIEKWISVIRWGPVLFNIVC